MIRFNQPSIVSCAVLLMLLSGVYALAGNTYFVLLAGGNGERLWPLSNEQTPKQLLLLGPDGSLLTQAIDRISPLANKSAIWVSTTEKHEHRIRSAVGTKVGTVLVEPGARNTAPAILYCCMKIHATDPDATVVFLPADAFIPKREWPTFTDYLATAIDHAQGSSDIVLLGLKPAYPATGYGYIEYDVAHSKTNNPPYHVTHFREKPSYDVAQQYLEDGNKLWNIGTFVGRVQTFIDEYQKAAPEIYLAMCRYIQGIGRYEDVPKDSIDYAVTERSKSVSVLPVDVSWCDVGNIEVFLTLKQEYSTLHANFVSVDARNNLVDVPGQTVALVGVHDLCVVQANGALLITKRDQAEQVRSVVDLLRQSGYALSH